MITTFQKWACAISLAIAFTTGGTALAAEIVKDGPVKTGTKVEELKATMGDPLNVVASEGEGVRVEKWMYPGDVVVVVQDGFVLDSFVEKK